MSERSGVVARTGHGASITNDMTKRFERLKDVELDNDDYTSLPILDSRALSTCQKCGAGYDARQFMALAQPRDAESVWTYPSSNVSIAVRECSCGNMLGRRIA